MKLAIIVAVFLLVAACGGVNTPGSREASHLNSPAGQLLNP